eukprot:TRINITY_DN1051_c0_g1_i4.p1 TRINITY_DN1051_c0_g1~~TRINITY_DN1051_c0_g1_i4.p1  ORF type:complete len:574 (+),score=196.61 TRINITY_DN1051_c0_g1_i4:191-1723(+)
MARRGMDLLYTAILDGAPPKFFDGRPAPAHLRGSLLSLLSPSYTSQDLTRPPAWSPHLTDVIRLCERAFEMVPLPGVDQLGQTIDRSAERELGQDEDEKKNESAWSDLFYHPEFLGGMATVLSQQPPAGVKFQPLWNTFMKMSQPYLNYLHYLSPHLFLSVLRELLACAASSSSAPSSSARLSRASSSSRGGNESSLHQFLALLRSFLFVPGPEAGPIRQKLVDSGLCDKFLEWMENGGPGVPEAIIQVLACPLMLQFLSPELRQAFVSLANSGALQPSLASSLSFLLQYQLQAIELKFAWCSMNFKKNPPFSNMTGSLLRQKGGCTLVGCDGNVDIGFESARALPFFATHVVLKAPASGCTAPVRSAAFYVSEQSVRADPSLRRQDVATFGDFCRVAQQENVRPVAILDLAQTIFAEQVLEEPVRGFEVSVKLNPGNNFYHLKRDNNIDVDYIAVLGYYDETPFLSASPPFDVPRDHDFKALAISNMVGLRDVPDENSNRLSNQDCVIS